MKYLIVSVLAVVGLSAAPAPRQGSGQARLRAEGTSGASAGQAKQTFTGTMTDDMCAGVGHARMRMGPTDAECTTACVMSHASPYVLDTGKNVYTLSDQKTPEQFAGKKVRVVGALDAKTKTIQVDSIAAAK